MELMSANGRAPVRTRPSAAGFSLIEVMVATLVLTVGVLSLGGVVGLGRPDRGVVVRHADCARKSARGGGERAQRP